MEKGRLPGFLFIYETAADGTAYYMRTLMDRLKVEEDRLDQE